MGRYMNVSNWALGPTIFTMLDPTQPDHGLYFFIHSKHRPNGDVSNFFCQFYLFLVLVLVLPTFSISIASKLSNQEVDDGFFKKPFSNLKKGNQIKPFLSHSF